MSVGCCVRRSGAFAIAPNAAGLTNPIPETIQQGSIRVGLQTVASGLAAPNFLTNAGDGTDRLFILEQPGQVRLVKNGVLQAGAFLDVSTRLTNLNFVDERGLIGMAFHPDYATPGADGFGKVYTHTSEPNSGVIDFDDGTASTNHQSVIAEWQVDAADPDQIDTNTRAGADAHRPAADESQRRHARVRAGRPALHRPGRRAAARTTRGSDTARMGNGQDMTKVLGKILRIDPFGNNSANGKYGIPDNPFVNDANVVDEIFFSGTRNPFRFSFETDAGGNLTNHIIIADVGQNDIEEVNRVNVTTQDGANFGWRIKEGTFLFEPDGHGRRDRGQPRRAGQPHRPDRAIRRQRRGQPRSSAGSFIKATPSPTSQGMYVFGDYEQPGTSHGRLFYADLDAPDPEIFELQLEGDQVTNGDLNLRLRGLGIDEQGEIYAIATPGFDTSDIDGVALRIVPAILLGDANNDGQVTGADLIAVQQNFGNTSATRTGCCSEMPTMTGRSPAPI